MIPSIRNLIIIISTAVLARADVQAQQHNLSVKDVLALIETGQPRLRAYKDQAAAAGDNIDLARNTLVPNLTGGYQAGYATDNNSTVTVSNNLHLRYVSLPLMAKLRFTGGFYIEAGPEVSLNVSSSDWENQSVQHLTNSAELGAAAGIGYQSPIGLGIGLRYTASLTNVDNTRDATWGDVNLRNSSFSLDLFWTLFNNRRLAENW